MVARREPLQAQVRPMDDDLAQLADLGPDAERGASQACACARSGGRDRRRHATAGTTLVPAVPASIRVDLFERADHRAMPVAPTNSRAACDLGTHRPGGEAPALELLGRDPVEVPLAGLAPVRVDGVDVGRHARAGPHPGRARAGELARSLSTTASTPTEPAVLALSYMVGMPPPPAQMTTPRLEQPAHRADLEDPHRPRRGHDAAPVVAVLLDGPALVLGGAAARCGLVVDRARRTWSDCRRRDRLGSTSTIVRSVASGTSNGSRLPSSCSSR